MGTHSPFRRKGGRDLRDFLKVTQLGSQTGSNPGSSAGLGRQPPLFRPLPVLQWHLRWSGVLPIGCRCPDPTGCRACLPEQWVPAGGAWPGDNGSSTDPHAPDTQPDTRASAGRGRPEREPTSRQALPARICPQAEAGLPGLRGPGAGFSPPPPSPPCPRVPWPVNTPGRPLCSPALPP